MNTNHRMAVGSNRYKALTALARLGSGSVAEVASASGLTSDQAGTALCGLAISGQASRSPIPNSTKFRYSILPSGRRALKEAIEKEPVGHTIKQHEGNTLARDRALVEAFWRKRHAELAEIQRGWDQ